MEHAYKLWELEAIISGLEAIKKGDIRCKIYGICYNLEDMVCECLIDVYPFLHKGFTTWEHWSGSLSYPIGLSGHDGWRLYENCSLSMWNPNTEYGSLRFNLLDHLIDFAKQEIANA